MNCSIKWSHQRQKLLIVTFIAAATIAGCEKSAPPASTTDSTKDKKNQAGPVDQSAGNSDSKTSPVAVPDGTPPDIASLIAKLGDEKVKVRVPATNALVKIGKAAVPALIAAVKDGNTDARISAAHALGRIGSDAKDAIPALTEAAKDQNKRVSAVAGVSLSQINGKK